MSGKTILLCISIFSMLLGTACTEEASNAQAEEEERAAPDAQKEPDPESRLVFVEFDDQSRSDDYIAIQQMVLQKLHNHYAWPGENSDIQTQHADSGAMPTIDFPRVHKFLNTAQTKELRHPDVRKVSGTWLPPTEKGQLAASFKFQRDERNTWTTFANPGTFHYPSDSQLAEGAQFDIDAIVEGIARTVVLITYK